MKRFWALLIIIFGSALTNADGGTNYKAGLLAVTSIPSSTLIGADFNSTTDIINRLKNSNILLIYPGQSVLDAYNWLKSKSRDSTMGVLSASNRRLLLLYPGTYPLTNSTLVLDANFVDIAQFGSENPSICSVTGSGSYVVYQIAKDIHLTGLTFKNTTTSGTAHTFMICAGNNGSDNGASIYRWCDFRHASATNYTRECVRGESDMDGLWSHCNSDSFGWRVAKDCNMFGRYEDLNAGDSSYGGDQDNNPEGSGWINATFIRCTGRNYCFGGCTCAGMDIGPDSYFADCIAGNNSYALCKNFAGAAYRCRGGMNCFGGIVINGGCNNGPYYNSFTGYAEDCITLGGCSFGMGDANSQLTGQIINCRDGDSGFAGVKRGNFYDKGARAAGTLDSASANGDLYFTAKTKGKLGNSIQVGKVLYGSNSTASFTCSSGIYRININQSGSVTANQVKAAIDADPVASQWISVAVEGDGSGNIRNIGAVTLTGGIDPFLMRDNYKKDVPIEYAAYFNVCPFENGQTYTNTIATGAITAYLPVCIKGLKFAFVDSNDTAGVDFSVMPQPTDKFVLPDGTAMNNGLGLINNDARHNKMTVECFDPNVWTLTSWGHPWSQD